MHESITSLMDKDHCKIEGILSEFEISLMGDLQDLKKIFNKFKWNLEKHFFIEEKAVFNIYSDIIGEEVGHIFDLMREHGEMMELLKMIESNISGDIKSDTQRLKILLDKHRKFEDVVFYPELDDKLQIDQKNEIAERIKEVVI